MKKKIVTFGELLLRFSKDDHLRLSQGDLFTSKYGGSEANVAVSLATLGEDVTYITRLPDNPIGHTAAGSLAQLGVDTSHVLYGGQRIGTYYFEPAAGMRSAKVVYDRAYSAYYDLKPGMIPWREILQDAAIFHVSGITAAISQQAADATFEALDIADELGITVSFDINYRKNLWQYGADPREIIGRMLGRCDMMFGDAIEFEWLCQRAQPPFTATDSHFEMQMDEYRAWFDDLHARFPRLRHWLMGMRNMVASNHHTLTALLWTDGELLQAPIIDIPDVVDPVGVGDAFMAGLLHAIRQFPENRQLQLNYALAAAALKNTVPGDFNLSTHEEIMDVVEERYDTKTLYKDYE
ncbi:MAG: sugar kinase [Prevotella sp.]|nr:sugar kinase [Prevotella sp.]MBQ9187432.1 sugar kinase [Prevotella sp.]